MRNQLTLIMWFHLLFFAPNLDTRASQTPIRTCTLLEYHHQKETNDNTAEAMGWDFLFKEKRKGQAELRALKATVKQSVKSPTKNNYKISMINEKKSTNLKTEIIRPVERNTVLFLLREWVERKMEKTRPILTEQLTTMESLVMRRETVMTAQSIGQVMERSIEVNEEPGSLINVLNVTILV